jgi:hypothetical protein
MKRSIVQSLGGYDARIPMQEDYPFWVKVTGLNHKLHFHDFNCAKYRIHKDSLTASYFITDRVNPAFLQSYDKTKSLIILPLLLRNKLYFHYSHHKMCVWRNNREGSGINKFLRYLSFLFDPLGIYIKFLHLRNIEYEYKFRYVIPEDSQRPEKDGMT